eukprot:5623421-Ditylum_brightwellii.AAC.1
MEDNAGKLPVKNIQRMQEDENVFDDLGILHVPDINDNEMNEILNVVDEKLPLAKPGWVDINYDVLVDMIAIFQ